MGAIGESQLERYDLVERIAVGGMAEVFRATAHGGYGFEKTLAIKRILPKLALAPEFEEHFITEAKLAVRLTHANIVQVFDFGRLGGSLFLAMEYVDGLDLAALLQRYRDYAGKLPLQAAFHIAIQICRGLDFAHRHGVIHRDVSPSNILLSKAGEVKIADFGIAMAAGPGRGLAASDGRIMGKWRYMSPEQTRGQNLQTRSDLFSAAAVMFELFTGEKLFPGSEPDDIIANIKAMDIPSATALRPELPQALDEVLYGALARDPEQRPERAAAMQRQLTEISYENNIVATDQEVAAAVAAVVAPTESVPEAGSRPGLGNLDELIRQQLSVGATEAERRTAAGSNPTEVANISAVERDTQRPATIVKTGVGNDGVTLWTLGPGGATEASGKGSATADNPNSRRRRRPALGLGIGLLVLAGVAIASGQLGSDRITQLEPPPVTPAVSLVIESVPAGAQVLLNDTALAGLTPIETKVRADQTHRVEISLTNYERYVDDEVTISATAPNYLSAILVPLHYVLEVRTTPSKANVRLGATDLGTTPVVRKLALKDLPPPDQRILTISKPGYETKTVPLEQPVPGQRLRYEHDLLARRRLTGTIKLQIDNSWANVYLDGRKIGRAPNPELRLPVGRHRLRLYNPETRREKWLDVRVSRQQQRYYRTSM